MSETCKLELDGQTHELPVVVGTENEKAINISKLRPDTGYITGDSGYGNTGSCISKVTFINGEKGILRYRGYPIEELAAKASFVEVCYLLIYGELPTKAQLAKFSGMLTEYAPINESFRHHFQGLPPAAHPMAILSAMINVAGCFNQELPGADDEGQFDRSAAVRTIAAYSHKASIGRPFIYPKPEYSYCENFLHMMFSEPYNEYQMIPEVVQAINLFFILHADHEQNCSTSTVRMVGSSQANLYASCAAGVCALWGPLHGGANMAVIDMLNDIINSGVKFEDLLAQAKDKSSGFKLMGFGHRVYKNFDPRAQILKKAADKVLAVLGIDDPSLEIAKKLEAAALEDEYFVQRKLYPNVDFYSGIILRAIGIPLNMFT
ncbi:citrate/2-methylcitrate synthase, partial [Candidatus Sumerlaeota bacterium]